MRVERLETWSGPGQAETLAIGLRVIRADVAGLRRVQDKHTAAITGLRSDVVGLTGEVTSLRATQDQHTAAITGLRSDVAGLKADVAEVKTDVAGLKTDVAGLKVAVARLAASVDEVLRRLPPAPATS